MGCQRLDGVEVRRCYHDRKEVKDTATLHTFTDASKVAYAAVTYAAVTYAAVTYIRHESIDSSVDVSFVAAKAKVSPIRAISIPRLELMAATMGVRLAETVSRILGIPLEQHTLWTDSMDVIYWVQGQSHRYKPFVANRISEIQEKTNPNPKQCE